MKKIFLAIMAAVICMGTFAQGPQGGQRREFNPEEFAKRQAERVQQATGASDKQYEALYGFFLRQMKATPRPQQGQRLSDEEREARRAEAEKRQKAHSDSIRAILTPEQFAKYEEAQKEWRQRGPQGGQRNQYGQGAQRQQTPQTAQPNQNTKNAKNTKNTKKDKK
jgi:hypothetical protein